MWDWTVRSEGWVSEFGDFSCFLLLAVATSSKILKPKWRAWYCNINPNKKRYDVFYLSTHHMCHFSGSYFSCVIAYPLAVAVVANYYSLAVVMLSEQRHLHDILFSNGFCHYYYLWSSCMGMLFHIVHPTLSSNLFFIEQALVRIWKGKSSHNVASRSVEKKMIADALLSS